MNISKNVCKKCNYWTRNLLYEVEEDGKTFWIDFPPANSSNSKPSKFGTCIFPKLVTSDDPAREEDYSSDTLVYSTLGCSGTYLKCGENFGCVHFVPKDNVGTQDVNRSSTRSIINVISGLIHELKRRCGEDKWD